VGVGGRFFQPLGKIGVRMVDAEATPDDPTADTHTTGGSSDPIGQSGGVT
jgi:uncharacterized protein